jgi:hypothetical protein
MGICFKTQQTTAASLSIFLHSCVTFPVTSNPKLRPEWCNASVTQHRSCYIAITLHYSASKGVNWQHREHSIQTRMGSWSSCSHGVYPENMSLQVASAAYILIHYLIMKKQHRKRHWWQTEMFWNRYIYSGSNLLADLKFQEISGHYKNFVRMAATDLEFLLHRITPYAVKHNTLLRDSIPIQERLALTLSFLATGDSYASLQYIFKISTHRSWRIYYNILDFFGSHRTVFALYTSITSTVFYLSTPFSKKKNPQHKLSHTVLTAWTEPGECCSNTVHTSTFGPNVAVTLHRHSLVWTRLKTD